MTPVGVIGSSARAAVHSLARAGFSAWAIDQFADRDLKCMASCAVCPSNCYPDAIPELAAQFPPGPVLYTGGLENHPHVLRELATQRALWGNPPEVVERVRDPFVLFPALAAAGFATPRLIARGDPCPREGRWLRKPLRSGGGIGIRFAQPGEPVSPHHYFQEFIDGLSMSVVFCGTTLLGCTEQLIGEPWLHAKGFAYCGNIGPVRELALPAFPVPLRGVWGLDFVLRGGVMHAVEVNPRYTAAVEVLEHASGCNGFREEPNSPSLFPGREGGESLPSPLAGEGGESSSRVRGEAHATDELRGHASLSVPSPASRPADLSAGRQSGREARPPSPARGEGEVKTNSPLPSLGREMRGVGFATIGKAIYYAPHTLRFPHSGPWDADLAGQFDPWRLPTFADIPEAGSTIEAGHPVLTFFATGCTPAEVRERLQSRAVELDLLFQGCTP